MGNFRVPAIVAACAAAVACNAPPSVNFLAEGDQGNVIGLTDDTGTCDTPARVAYLTSLDGTSVRGCWVRDRSYVLVRFKDVEDRRVPVGDFRQTEFAGYRNLSLN